jgi:hypothetical protein
VYICTSAGSLGLSGLGLADLCSASMYLVQLQEVQLSSPSAT